MSVTYTAALTVREETVLFVARLLNAERARRGTRAGTRAMGCFKQAILVLRWFLDGTRLRQLAADNSIGKSTAYDYLHEGIGVLAARAPKLESALLAAKAAGHPHITIDGTLIETDRCRTPGPTPGVDLWWSGRHDNHGGNIQVITAPDGWPLWTSDVRPGREHDTTAVRTHTELLPVLRTWTDEDLPVLGDLGYEGEADTITVAFKKPQGGQLTDEQKAHNKAHNGKRAIGERANSLLKTTFKALRNVSLCPWKIGKIAAAALVLLHIEHDRTT
jgi:DDE superfamily endonuclease